MTFIYLTTETAAVETQQSRGSMRRLGLTKLQAGRLRAGRLHAPKVHHQIPHPNPKGEHLCESLTMRNESQRCSSPPCSPPAPRRNHLSIQPRASRRRNRRRMKANAILGPCSRANTTRIIRLRQLPPLRRPPRRPEPAGRGRARRGTWRGRRRNRRRRCRYRRGGGCGSCARPEPAPEFGSVATTTASSHAATGGRYVGVPEGTRGVPRRTRLHRQVG